MGGREKQKVVCVRLDEWFLSVHNRPSPMSLQFPSRTPHRDAEVVEETIFSHLEHLSISTFELCELWRGCVSEDVRMPPVEETLASYLSQGESFSLKALAIPSKLLQTISC